MSPQVYQPHFMARNQYTRSSSPPSPPPAPVVHTVWILDCKSCGTFLTNRAMKAVLLLRPNVPLYSSDAPPANCSPWSPEPEEWEEDSSSDCHSSQSSPRTCECQTQSLCCHGCGSTVGYNIVAPCQRCTSSVANRSTNGHRFVFHSSEIDAVERRFVPGEAGVKVFEPVHFAPQYPPRSQSPVSDEDDCSGSAYTTHRTRHLNSMESHTVTRETTRTSFLAPSSRSRHQNHYQHHEFKEHPNPRRLQAGDVVYWHNLTRGGEARGVQDDDRARQMPFAPGSPETGHSFGIAFDR